MQKTVTCIVCPKGCKIEVTVNGTDIKVSGNECKRGAAYAEAECTFPVRSLASVVRVENRKDTMLPVKTAAPIPKDKMFEAVTHLRSITVNAPVSVGDVIVEDLFGTQILATKDLI